MFLMTSLHSYLTEKKTLFAAHTAHGINPTQSTLCFSHKKSNSPYIPFLLFSITIYRTLRNINNTTLFYMSQYNAFSIRLSHFSLLRFPVYYTKSTVRTLPNILFVAIIIIHSHAEIAHYPFHNIVFVHHNHKKQITLFPFPFFCTPEQTIKCMRVSV